MSAISDISDTGSDAMSIISDISNTGSDAMSIISDISVKAFNMVLSVL